MSNDPSPAVGTARRSFWIAVFGGFCSMACRVDVLGRGVQSVLNLLGATCLLIAFAFGAVALIRMRSTERNAVLIPALSGLLLGLALLANLSNWSRDQWVKARLRAREAKETPAPQPPTPAGKLPDKPPAVSVVKYELPALDRLADMVAGAKASAARAQGDDAAVLRAWAVHLEKIQGAYTDTFTASNKLHEIDLLDPKLISNLNEDEAIARRGLANKYSDAWHELGQKLSTFPGAYNGRLHDARVPSERANVESQAVFSLMEQPAVAARLASLQKLCKAEEDVGRHYNYAVSAVCQYAGIASRMPNPPPHFRARMDTQISKLKEMEQAAAESRREAFAKPDQGP